MTEQLANKTLALSGNKGTVRPKHKGRKPAPRKEAVILVDYRNGSIDDVVKQASDRFASAGYNGKVHDLIVAMIPPMIWARDNAGMRVGPLVLSRLLSLDTIQQILNRQHKDFVRVPDSVLKGVRLYLNGLNGYTDALGADQGANTLSHHSFVENKAVDALVDKRKKNFKGKGKFVKNGKEQAKEPANTFVRSNIVDRVNGYQIQKNAKIADAKQIDVAYTVLAIEGGLDVPTNPEFKSLGEAREFAKGATAAN